MTLKGACIIGQSGGPTSVINASAYGCIKTALENENITDIKILSKIAVSCGIEESEANKILENNYYNIDIYLDQEEAISYGITATPCFILNHKGERLIMPGAFSSEEFENALKNMLSGKIEKKTFA